MCRLKWMMLIIIWSLLCSLVSLGLRVLQRKLLKGVVQQVAVLSALTACFHHLLWVLGSKEVWWVGSGRRAWKRRGQRHWLWLGIGAFCLVSISKGYFEYFPFFLLSKLVSLIPSPSATIIVIFFHTLLYFVILCTGRVFLCLCFSSFLCGLWCLWSSILGTGILTGFFLLPPHIPLEDCLGKEAAILHLILTAKLMWKQYFGLFNFPVPSKNS